MTEATAYARALSLRIGIFSYTAIRNLSSKINLTLIQYFYLICHPYSNLSIGSLISSVAFIFSPKRGSNISSSCCTSLGCFNLKYFHSLPLSLVCHFWRIDFSPHFCMRVLCGCLRISLDIPLLISVNVNFDNLIEVLFIVSIIWSQVFCLQLQIINENIL